MAQTLNAGFHDSSATYGPGTPTDLAGPYLDGGTTYGPASFTRPTRVSGAFLDGGVCFAPYIVQGDAEVLVVFVNGVRISNAFAVEFRDELNDAGSWSFRVSHSWLLDNWSSIDYGDLVQFKVFGITAFSGYVGEMDMTHIDADNGPVAEQVVVSGMGRGGFMARDVIYPSRGVGALPIEDVRSFSWPSPDFDDTYWPTAKLINRQRMYANWDDAGVPGAFVGGAGPVPHIWPNFDGWWIWANRDDCTHAWAPAGQCYFRKSFSLAAETRVRIFASFDNGGIVYIDGAEVIPMTVGFMEGRYVEITLSAGTHYVAVYMENAPHGGMNPGGLIAAGYSIDLVTGLLNELLFETDTTWKCLAYPPEAPGFTHGEILDQVISEGVARSTYTGLTYDFSANLDSEGNPWERFKDVSVGVGRTGLEFLVEMSQSYIDWEMLHGSTPVLRAWVLGTRGQDLSNEIVLERFRSLRHVGKQVRLNKALTRYGGGHIQTTDATSVSAHGAFGGYLELGDIRSESAATHTTENVMSTRKDPSYSTQAEIIIPPGPHREFGVDLPGASGDHVSTPWSGSNPKGLYLPGTAGHSAYTPHHASLALTDNIDIRIKVAVTDWTTGANQVFVGKYGYTFFLNNTDGKLAWYQDRTVGGVLVVFSSVAPTVTDGAPIWLRVTRSGATVRFYTRPASGGAWVQLGTDVTGAAGALTDNSGTDLHIGRFIDGSSPLAGVVHEVQILNGIDGTAVVDVDFADTTQGWAVADTNGATGIDGAGKTFAILGANSVVRSTLDVTGDIDLRFRWLDITSPGVIAAKRSASLSLAWCIYVDGTSLNLVTNPTGVVENWNTFLSFDHNAYNGKWIRLKRTASSGSVTAEYGPTVDGPWTTIGTNSGTAGALLATTDIVEVGSQFTGTSARTTGTIAGFQMRDGIGGDIVAYPDFTEQTLFVDHFDDDQGNTWTLNGAASITSSITSTIHPHAPYRKFRVGDWITCLNEQNVQESMRVSAITVRQDTDSQVVSWGIELRDLLLEADIRHEAWLRRMADGASFGGARVSAAHGTPAPFSSTITTLTLAEFSFDNAALTASTSPKRPVTQTGNLVECYGQLTTAGTTTTTVQVWYYKGNTGVTALLGTLTFPAGEDEAEFGIDAIPAKANIDKTWVVITAAGTGAEGLDVQVRGL